MNKIPSQQLKFDFSFQTQSNDTVFVCFKSSPLTLAYSNPDNSTVKMEAATREKMLSNAISYARTLSW